MLRYIFLLHALFFVSFIKAQQHVFVSYSVKEGLAQSQVRDIIQTKDGFIWIATVGGASRFDGRTFTTFNKSRGLLDNLATSLYEMEDGRLIIGGKGGFSVLEKDSIYQVRFKDENYKEALIFDIDEIQGVLWLATNGFGVIRYDWKSFNRLDLGTPDRNFVRSISKSKNAINLGTKSGLLSVAEDKTTVLIDSISVYRITEDQQNTWVTTDADGVIWIKDGIRKYFTIEDGLSSDHQRDVCIDQFGNPWFITKNVVTRFDLTSQKFEKLDAVNESNSSNLKVLFADKESNIWIGTDGNGILKYTGDQFITFTSFKDHSFESVMCITQDDFGNFWLGTYGQGVIKMNGQNVQSYDYSDGVKNSTIWSVLARKDGSIWVGTSEGISIITPEKVSDFKFNSKLPFPRVSALFEDSENRVWIGTRDGFLVATSDAVIPTGFSTEQVKEVKSFKEAFGSIWISSNIGIIRVSIDLQEMEVISSKNGLNDNNISCIEVDPYGHLWAGEDEGVDVITIDNLEIHHIDISQKFSSNIVDFIQAESNTNMWIGTDDGLFSIDLIKMFENDSIVIESYNEHDGVIGQECNQNAAFQDKSGKVWFGTNGSLISYNPDHTKNAHNDLLLIKINDIQVNFESIKDRSQKNAELSSFAYSENRLSFRFSAIHYSNPEKVFYSYRLIGSDENWSPATKENYITYANLSPGDYVFEVRAKLENGNWNRETASFQFEITPPFYKRWWFIFLGIVAAVLAGFLIIYQIERERKRKQKVIELQNKAKILGLEQQTLNAHMNRHFIFNALNSIQYFINTQDRKQANTYLTNFATLVRKNLDSAQVESINLNEELERLKLYLNLEQLRFKDRFEYQISIDESLDIETLVVPSMILQPFVENSIMHGILPSDRNGLIDINIKGSNDELILEICDNGIGIENSLKQKQSISTHVSNGMKITKQRMDLLKNITKRNYGVNGPFEVFDENKTVIGTKVVINIPQYLT